MRPKALLSRLIAMLLVALTVQGCVHRRPAGVAQPSLRGTVETAALPPAAAPPVMVASAVPVVPVIAEPPYQLDSGDRLRIQVFGQEGLTNSYVVDAAGYVSLSLIGLVPARGLTTAELAAAITAGLRAGYIRNPHVSVEIEAYRPFFILGEVNAPGQYPYVPNMTVEAAVAIAGGFAPRANKRDIVLARQLNGATMRMRVPVDLAMKPGDTITVRERWF